jgi:DNA-binding LytR/AlgR family response regulator
MIRIAMIDDEAAFLQFMKDETDKFFHTAGVDYEIRTYGAARELLWDIEEGDYFDIYLLDIELPAVSGMELAHAIRQKYDEPYIIFVTSYLKYSVKGYEYNAWRYITKDKAGEMLPLAFESLLKKIEDKGNKFYIIELHSKLAKIAYNDIYYLHKDGKYTIFHTKQDVLKERKALAKIYDELKDEVFIFTDRSFIVNLRHVMTLGDHMIIMRNGDEIPVSIPQFRKVKKAISDYWRGHV